MPRSGRLYLVAALAVIVGGVLSRLLHSGMPLLDKYLGDALYATLVYLLLRAWRPARAPAGAALASVVLLIAIESFQRTGIPSGMARSDNAALKLLAIGLGTGFSWYDLLAYAVGVGAAAWADYQLLFSVRMDHES